MLRKLDAMIKSVIMITMLLYLLPIKAVLMGNSIKYWMSNNIQINYQC